MSILLLCYTSIFSVTVDVTNDRLVLLEMDAGSYAEGLVSVANNIMNAWLQQELAIRNNICSPMKKNDKVKLDAICPLY